MYIGFYYKVNMKDKESINYSEVKKERSPHVYVVQEIAGTREGRPKFNIMGAAEYGVLKFLLDERSQMIFSPGPLIIKLKNLLKDFKPTDYLLLTGDPAIIGVVCCLISEQTNGRLNLLKWDRQEKRYYPIEIDIYGTGAKNDD
jgi:hypothetical protein